MALLYVNVDNPDELLTLYGAGALIRWEYSADGSTSWSEGGTEAIVSGTTRYVIEHLTATSYYYRTRYSKASPSVAADYSAYSDVWQVGALAAYGTLADLKEMLSLGTTTDRDNHLTDLLEDVSADIDAMCQRTFLRQPQVSGDVTVYFDVAHTGCTSLVDALDRPMTVDGRALDIVSVTNLYARQQGGSYIEITAGDAGYYLESTQQGAGIAGTTWSYGDITLSPDSTSWYAWPTGKRAVKLIGALGFPAVPAVVKRACLGEAAERFRQRSGTGPSPAGINQFGTPIFLTGDSLEMRRLSQWPFTLRRMAA